MMLLKIDINKWFSWLNLGIKDPSTASAVVLYSQLENHEKGNNREFAHEETVIYSTCWRVY